MMKRIFLLFVVFILNISSFGQSYNKVIRDTSIINFMSWLFESDTAFKAIRFINKDIIKWNIGNARSMVTIDQSYDNYHHKNIVDSNLSKYFTEKDADYLIFQVKGQKKVKWRLELKNIRLLSNDTIKLIDYRANPVVFSYSLPLFSRDNRYVVIIEAFYCGLVCGGGSYNLYERQTSNSWKKIKEIHEWSE